MVPFDVGTSAVASLVSEGGDMADSALLIFTLEHRAPTFGRCVFL